MEKLNQCARCGHHIHPEHEVLCKTCKEVTCIGCSWKCGHDDKDVSEVREHTPSAD